MSTLIRRPGTNAVLSYEPITDSAGNAGWALDLYLDAANHEDPVFLRRCTEFLLGFMPPGSRCYGFLPRFPDDPDILQSLDRQSVPHRHEAGGLLFELTDPRLIEQLMISSVFYFGVLAYLVVTACPFERIRMPKTWLFGDLWTPVCSLPDAIISAQISIDHPGMLVHLRRDVPAADLLQRFERNM